MYEAIESYPTLHIIGIYVAPLREHLQAPSQLVQQYNEIPAYPIHSHEMKMTEPLLQSYKQWLPEIRQNANFWEMIASKFSKEKIAEQQQILGKARKVIKRIELFKSVDLGDEKIRRDQITRAVYELEGLIEQFLQFLINAEAGRAWRADVFRRRFRLRSA